MNISIILLGNLFLLAVAFFVAVSQMKRNKKLTAILLLVFLGITWSLLYLEAHFGHTLGVLSDMSEEEILAEMPDIAISEKDISMMDELLKSEEIAEAFLLAEEKESGMYGFPVEKGEKLLGHWSPEGYEFAALSVSTTNGKCVSFLFLNDVVGDHILYSIDAESVLLQKHIAVYKKDILGAEVSMGYSNINGQIAKTETERIWFDWLRKDSIIEIN